MKHIHRMDKFSKAERESLLYDLVYALVNTKSANESILFLEDLLTRAEITTLAKRLRIAKLLLEGFTYEEIQKVLHVSHSTVGKISAWLAKQGEGFRTIIKKLPKQENAEKEIGEWGRVKRKYSMYFWPELLLEEIIKNSNNEQKKRLHDMLSTIDGKSDLHKRMQKLLKYATT